MAEMDNTAGGNRHKKTMHLNKKNSTRVDLTPMVDLGFLLITFFMVTTAWTKPHVTNLNMPADGERSQIGKQAVLTILAGNNNKVFYFHGALDEALKNGSFGNTNYSVQNGIGEIIRQKKMYMDKYYKGGSKEMMVLIKPSPESSYENIVNLLDEMLINNVGKYAIVDISKEELVYSLSK